MSLGVSTSNFTSKFVFNPIATYLIRSESYKNLEVMVLRIFLSVL